ncbi:DEAD/DEAH box helicase [Micromonospora halotolerans]|uniref:DEAD/DEAH box helicase n=1 Tax=Micromonospora halotolerans TaxID=709879 RepID=A0ABZ0A2C3_9ACTN|nr:DEAD/DEAH box helicase [Micromonospora halotolerans]WNM41689.1 DEAD/DEAH box helicase [Micromonospora halotolerans]
MELDPGRRGVLIVPRHQDLPTLRSVLRRLPKMPRGRSDNGCLLFRFEDGPQVMAAGDGLLDWTVDAERAIQNRVRVRTSAAEVVASARSVLAGGADAARVAIADSHLVDRLDDHQALNVAALTVDGSWGGCVFDEQGTGKTITMIATFDLLVERNLADVLVVMAPKSMVREWAVQFDQFTDGMYRVAVIEGSKAEKSKALASGADVVVMNYESAVTSEPAVRLLARRCRTVLAVDESFNVKNPDARRTSAIARIREWCTHAFALCGTPAPNSPADMVAQFDLVDFGYTFGPVRLDHDPEVALGQVRDAVTERGHYVRNLKSIVLKDLPGRSFNRVKVQMQPVQAAAYAATLDGLITDVRQITDAEFRRQSMSFLARRASLLRLCSDPSGVVDGYDEVPAKVAALDDLLDQLVRQHKEKVLLWSFYRSNLDNLATRYGPLGLVRVDGSVPSEERREAVRRFQDDDDVMVFLGNPAAAGAGLTLHRARVAVYESLSNQAAHYLQSLDRIHRRGQARDVEYITLLCEGTIEEPEYDRLLTKAQTQADLLGDPPDPQPTRVLLLEELLKLRATVGAVHQHG